MITLKLTEGHFLPIHIVCVGVCGMAKEHKKMNHKEVIEIKGMLKGASLS